MASATGKRIVSLPELVKVDAVASELGIAKSVAYRVCQHLDYFKIGKRVRVSRESLDLAKQPGALDELLRKASRDHGGRRSKKEYGLSADDREQLLSAQGGKCLVCKKALGVFGRKSNDACVDHCHVTGYVRGVLCNMCNRGLGLFFDSPDAMRSAADYIESSRKNGGRDE